MNGLIIKNNYLFFLLLLPLTVAAGTVKDCQQNPSVIHEEFHPLDFEKGRSTVGSDQIEPAKIKILNFLKSNIKHEITEVKVTASSARVPVSVLEARKKKMTSSEIDKENLSISQQRMYYIGKALGAIKSSRSEYAKIKFSTHAVVAGPEFQVRDLNTRFVSKMTPHYEEKVKELFDINQNEYKNEALVQSHKDLLDEKQFMNLYQAKYKPFQGLKITITGFDKAACEDHLPIKEVNPEASKQ